MRRNCNDEPRPEGRHSWNKVTDSGVENVRPGEPALSEVEGAEAKLAQDGSPGKKVEKSSEPLQGQHRNSEGGDFRGPTLAGVISTVGAAEISPLLQWRVRWAQELLSARELRD